ncbi:MAG: T9SS type A sorting domain-containing protein, partial [Ignavibacteriae bacterium]|nr:T9SS type A sorting domain-containing protein [Ignavibacteriota bacterium]
GNNIFAGTLSNGLFLSTNNGTNWTQTALNNHQVMSLAVSGNNIFAGTLSNGVYLSTNNGTNWSQTSLNNKNVKSLSVSGNNVFSGTDSNGVYFSANNGTNWIQKNQGFNGITSVYALLIANNYILAGTYQQSVWLRLYSEAIGINKITENVPSKYSLSQNYPNPFNPTTNIKFNVAKLSDVKIVVYDIMGREVQTLVNESLQPGIYEVSFDGSKLTSGVYFYRLISDNFTDTKRMLLVK